MSRPVVSYDDITLPYDSAEPEERPTKKRKWNNKNQKRKGNNTNGYHSQPSVSAQPKAALAPSENTAEEEYEEHEEESRELSYNDIWDDSALVEAWEAATEEYEMYHGANKDWKTEPVKKSPLWYNIPIENKKPATNATAITGLVPTIPEHLQSTFDDTGDAEEETDSVPINFDTFVPKHDPSLSTNPAAGTDPSGSVPDPAAVSQDEAFQRATTAMYWAGYWTAMYHCQRSNAQKGKADEGKDTVNEEDENMVLEESEEEVQPADVTDGFVPTQR